MDIDDSVDDFLLLMFATLLVGAAIAAFNRGAFASSSSSSPPDWSPPDEDEDQGGAGGDIRWSTDDDISPGELVLTPPTIVGNGAALNTVGALDTFALAIRDFEGRPGDRNYRNNNPGNARFYSGGYAPQYGAVRSDPDGYAIFPTYAQGWAYLKALIALKASRHALWDILQFFQDEYDGWAPASDGNDPVAYAAFVAARLGVTSSTRLDTVLRR